MLSIMKNLRQGNNSKHHVSWLQLAGNPHVCNLVPD